MIRPALLASLAAAALACSDPTAPLRPVDATIDARYVGLVGSGPGIVDPVTVSLSGGTLTVTGPISTATTCPTFSVAVDANDRTARVRVVPGPNAGNCFPAFALHEYEVVAQLASGPRRVIVEHVVPGAPATRVADVRFPD